MRRVRTVLSRVLHAYRVKKPLKDLRDQGNDTSNRVMAIIRGYGRRVPRGSLKEHNEEFPVEKNLRPES